MKIYKKPFMLITLLTTILLLNGCSMKKKSPYDRFTANKSEMVVEISNLSSSSDNNICLLDRISQKEMRSNQIQKRIQKGVEKEIKKRGLDCSEPFPQDKDPEDSKMEGSNIFKILKGITLND